MSVHAIGNGRVCAYIDGTRIDQIFGPGYSSPVALQMEVEPADYTATCREVFGVWRSEAGDDAIVDWVDPEKPLFHRDFKVFRPTRFTLRAQNIDRLFPIPSSLGLHGLMGTTFEGTLTYPYEFVNGQLHGYVSGKRRYFGLSVAHGTASITLLGATTAVISTGDTDLSEGELTLAFADTPEELFALLTQAAEGDFTARINLSNAKRASLLSRLPDGRQPYAEVVLDVYDAITAQQAVSGGVLAGNNYHLCYVRDNYGVFRGLMAMGAYEEAQRLVEYYIDVYARHGRIHNAQGPSEPAFHVHENDAVEITGYLVDMIARTYAHSGDAAFARRAEPLAAYCLSRQHDELCDGLLPFNGDETYIAGGLLPRAAINDASMEATALYHRAICDILAMQRTLEGYTGLPFLASDKAAMEKAFLPAFLTEEGLVCNRPSDTRRKPIFRTGVRFCGHGLGLSFRNENGDYVCPACMEKKLPPLCGDEDGRVYSIPSAILCPVFVGTSLIPVEVIRRTVRHLLDELPRRSKIVGYDYGLLLYAIRAARMDTDTAICTDIVERMLALRDEHGVWNEYYADNRPAGTPCRPWESAINTAALLEALPS